MDTERADEWSSQDITNLDKTAFSVKVPTLQDIVYSRLAIEVWNYGKRGRIIRFAEIHYLNKSKCLQPTDCFKYIETLGIPRSMKEILKTHFKKLCEETTRCVIHFKYRLFSTKLDEYKISKMDWNCFVWFPNGRIDYKNTAIKLISSSELTKEQKFAIMCKHCLENELNTFSLNQISIDFIIKVTFNNDPLIFYWICHLRKELQRIPFQAADSIDFEMATRCRVETCEAFEYFWDRLSEEDQVQLMISRLKSCYNVSYEGCRLFHKMSHDQKMNLLFSRPVEMIIDSLHRLNMPRCAIWAWIHAKHQITDEQFVQIMRSLRQSHNDIVANGRIHYDEEKMSAFLEIWDTATDSQRNESAANWDVQFDISRILQGPYSIIPNGSYKVSSSGLKFVLKYLMLKSSDCRKMCMNNNYLNCLFQTDFDVMNEILELCLPNPSDRESFTKSMATTLTELPYCCELLYRVEDYDELRQRLQTCFENVNFTSRTAKELVESTILHKHDEEKVACYTSYHDHRVSTLDLRGLSIFINDILPQYTSSISLIKNSLISSLTTAIDPFEQCVILHELCKVIEVEFVNEHLTDLKHRCVQFFKESDVSSWISFSEEFFDVFSWCFDNDREKRPELKHDLPIDTIFYESFRSENLEGLYPRLCVLDECLKYHFSDCIDELIEFKLSQIQHPSVVKIFKSVAKYDELLYEELFQWFNSYDLNSVPEPADPKMEAESPATLVPILSRCNFSG